MQSGEGEWVEIQRRRRQPGGHWKFVGCCTFFFRNFPENCSVEMLRQKFGEVGSGRHLYPN